MPEVETPEPAYTHFWDPRSITVGEGRILWAHATIADGKYWPDGYCLPGGTRTADPQRARRVAAEIDRITRGARK